MVGAQSLWTGYRRPHGERSALEKFLKSKGSGPGCHTRPSLCADIVPLIKGAGPGESGAGVQATGQGCWGMPKGPLPPFTGTRAEEGSGRGAQSGRTSSRSPAPPQVAGGGLYESVNEGSKRWQDPSHQAFLAPAPTALDFPTGNRQGLPLFQGES